MHVTQVRTRARMLHLPCSTAPCTVVPPAGANGVPRTVAASQGWRGECLYSVHLGSPTIKPGGTPGMRLISSHSLRLSTSCCASLGPDHDPRCSTVLILTSQVIKNLEGAGYSDDDINLVVRALFLRSGEARDADHELRLAYCVFDARGNERLPARDFRQILMLLGDAVTKAQVDAVCELADSDLSDPDDIVDFENFATMIRGLPECWGSEPGSPRLALTQ